MFLNPLFFFIDPASFLLPVVVHYVWLIIRKVIYSSEEKYKKLCVIVTIRKIKFFVEDFFSKREQICSFLQICSHLQKKF